MASKKPKDLRGGLPSSAPRNPEESFLQLRRLRILEEKCRGNEPLLKKPRSSGALAPLEPVPTSAGKPESRCAMEGGPKPSAPPVRPQQWSFRQPSSGTGPSASSAPLLPV
eukprot:RCo009264